MAAFAKGLIQISQQIGFAISSRGWCYQLESFGLVTKAQFDLVENLVNDCRKRGYLTIDFTAEEEARKFSGVEKPETLSPVQYMKQFLNATLRCEDWYTPEWWDGETYYIQMVVEKIDIKTLFEPVCQEYHIPIATSKGWSSMLQRAEYARRFKEAEDKGLQCVLLYCGDHDPDGLRISEFLRSNLEDLRNITWNDGAEGYDPEDLKIVRFGLNYDFIEANKLSWIDNLITGSGKNLADPSHPNYSLPYVQEYLARIGPRKCEANALVPKPDAARELCRRAIEDGNEEWDGLGHEALDRFQEKRDAVVEELQTFREKTGCQKGARHHQRARKEGRRRVMEGKKVTSVCIKCGKEAEHFRSTCPRCGSTMVLRTKVEKEGHINPFSTEQLYILKVAVALFKITDPFKKDDRGFNRIDAWLFKYMLTKDVDDFTIHNLEWMRRKLLSYRRQIGELGFTYELICTRISDKAIFGWKVLEDSKFLGMDLKIDKDTRFTFKWRVFRDNHVEKVQVVMDRAEGVKLLIEQGYFKSTQDANDLKIKVSYYPGEMVRNLLEKFGLKVNHNSQEHSIEA
jgi:predicted RNA-binding Zn-ribbon protein involved in translation (DUF1610 family)